MEYFVYRVLNAHKIHADWCEYEGKTTGKGHREGPAPTATARERCSFAARTPRTWKLTTLLLRKEDTRVMGVAWTGRGRVTGIFTVSPVYDWLERRASL